MPTIMNSDGELQFMAFVATSNNRLRKFGFKARRQWDGPTCLHFVATWKKPSVAAGWLQAMLGLLFQHQRKSMPSIRHQEYEGYAIVAMSTPAGSGKYHSIFSVRPSARAEDTNHHPFSQHENISESPAFATEAEAIDAAHDRAKAWIDTRTK